MTGQLIQVTIRDGREPKNYLTDTSDTNTETDNFTTTEDDDDDQYYGARQRSKFGLTRLSFIEVLIFYESNVF